MLAGLRMISYQRGLSLTVSLERGTVSATVSTSVLAIRTEIFGELFDQFPTCSRVHMSMSCQPRGQSGGLPHWEADGGVDRPARPRALHGKLPAGGHRGTAGETWQTVPQVGRPLPDDAELQGQCQPPQLSLGSPQARAAVQAQSDVQILLNIPADLHVHFKLAKLDF